jgi:hypothetical protein
MENQKAFASHQGGDGVSKKVGSQRFRICYDKSRESVKVEILKWIERISTFTFLLSTFYFQERGKRNHH